MKEEIISYKTAKLAKERGFNGFCMFYYEKSTKSLKPIFNGQYHIDEQDSDNLHFGFDMNAQSNSYYSAPTQSLLQKWLREKHLIFVKINSTIQLNWYWEYIKYSDKPHHSQHPAKIGEQYVDHKKYNSYEKALEKGLQETLKLIKDE